MISRTVCYKNGAIQSSISFFFLRVLNKCLQKLLSEPQNAFPNLWETSRSKHEFLIDFQIGGTSFVYVRGLDFKIYIIIEDSSFVLADNVSNLTKQTSLVIHVKLFTSFKI